MYSIPREKKKIHVTQLVEYVAFNHRVEGSTPFMDVCLFYNRMLHSLCVCVCNIFFSTEKNMDVFLRAVKIECEDYCREAFQKLQNQDPNDPEIANQSDIYDNVQVQKDLDKHLSLDVKRKLVANLLSVSDIDKIMKRIDYIRMLAHEKRMYDEILAKPRKIPLIVWKLIMEFVPTDRHFEICKDVFIAAKTIPKTLSESELPTTDWLTLSHAKEITFTTKDPHSIAVLLAGGQAGDTACPPAPPGPFFQ